MLYGTAESEPQADIVIAQLAQELYNSNLLLLLVQNLSRIDFEGKKDVAQVFNNILRRQIGTRSPTVEYICTKPEILFTLMSGYVKFWPHFKLLWCNQANKIFWLAPYCTFDLKMKIFTTISYIYANLLKSLGIYDHILPKWIC